MASVERRLTHVEAALGPDEDQRRADLDRIVTLDRLARGSRVLAALNVIAATMAPEHLAIVQADFDEHGWHGAGWHGSTLTQRVWSIAQTAANGHHRGPLAMPPEAAAIYRDDPHAQPLHRCVVCGWEAPYHSGYRQVTRVIPNGGTRIRGEPVEPSYSHFNTCPLCGGDVRYPRSDLPQPPRYVLDDELVALVRQMLVEQLRQDDGADPPAWLRESLALGAVAGRGRGQARTAPMADTTTPTTTRTPGRR